MAKVTCPACGAEASGKFCSNCGSALAGAGCPRCGAALTPGARFCHRCGTGVAAGDPAATADKGGFAGALPWTVAAIALVALIALVAGQRFARGPAAAAPEAGADPGVRASTDIANMPLEEQAERLYNRVMRYDEENKPDSAQFFAPMAINTYQQIEHPTVDQRYDLGRIAAVAGQPDIARAEADTILKSNPTHLLGLILAAQAASMRNDAAAAKRYMDRLAAAERAERAKQLPEYQLHANDIDAALRDARR